MHGSRPVVPRLPVALFSCALVLSCSGPAAAEPQAEPRWAVGAGLSFQQADPTRDPYLLPRMGAVGGGSGSRIVADPYRIAWPSRGDPTLLEVVGPALALGFEARVASAWWVPLDVTAAYGRARGFTIGTGLRHFWQVGSVRPSLQATLAFGLGRADEVTSRHLLGAVGGALDVRLLGSLWFRGTLDLFSVRREWWRRSDTLATPTDYLGVRVVPSASLSIWMRFR